MNHFLPRTGRLRTLGIAAMTVVAAAAAHAQSSSSGGGYSLLPWTQQGYVGLNLGASDYDTPCGSGSGCDNANVAMHLYTGGMFNQWVGVEAGYINMGNADRGGGTTRAHGINVSVVGRLPLGPVNLFAKGGATYGRTKITADASSGVVPGKSRGTGASIGAGVGYDFNRNSSVVLEYARHQFHFAGVGRESVDMASVGYVYRF
jgi:OmpA-OmpF porin, OOP family